MLSLRPPEHFNLRLILVLIGDEKLWFLTDPNGYCPFGQSINDLDLILLIVHREGKLVDEVNPNCLYSAEYHSGQLALRDVSGAYLSPIGSKAVLKSRSNSVTKDELFLLEDSLPQASFIAALNSRYVSVKQGE